MPFNRLGSIPSFTSLFLHGIIWIERDVDQRDGKLQAQPAQEGYIYEYHRTTSINGISFV